MTNLTDKVRVARNLQQNLGLLGLSAPCCNFSTPREKELPYYSLSMALEEAFKA